jgi:hypothetical protein
VSKQTQHTLNTKPNQTEWSPQEHQVNVARQKLLLIQTHLLLNPRAQSAWTPRMSGRAEPPCCCTAATMMLLVHQGDAGAKKETTHKTSMENPS